MKVGDKVYVELEIETIHEPGDSFTGRTNDGKRFSHKKELITQLPIQEGRWMMVSDDEKNWEGRYITHKQDGMFASPIYVPAFSKYAKEIPTKRKLTMQEIAEKFNEDVDNIEIECQK